MFQWLCFKAPHVASNVFFASIILPLFFNKILSVVNHQRYFTVCITCLFHSLKVLYSILNSRKSLICHHALRKTTTHRWHDSYPPQYFIICKYISKKESPLTARNDSHEMIYVCSPFKKDRLYAYHSAALLSTFLSQKNSYSVRAVVVKWSMKSSGKRLLIPWDHLANKIIHANSERGPL